MNTKLASWFVFSSAVVLFVSAAFILLGTTTGTLILETPDAFFPVSSRYIFYLVAGIQLALSALLLVAGSPKVKLVLLAFVSCNLLIYHIGLSFTGEANWLVCLGSLTPRVPASPRLLNGLIYVMLGWLFSGSCAFLAGDWLSHRRPAPLARAVPSLQNG